MTKPHQQDKKEARIIYEGFLTQENLGRVGEASKQRWDTPQTCVPFRKKQRSRFRKNDMYGKMYENRVGEASKPR